MNKIKIDPKMPDCFYDEIEIDDMPRHVVDEWWQKPFIKTRGKYFVVLCLDGGAWDRPSLKASCDSKEKAIAYIQENYEEEN